MLCLESFGMWCCAMSIQLPSVAILAQAEFALGQQRLLSLHRLQHPVAQALVAGSRDQGPGTRVQGPGSRVRSRVQGAGTRVQKINNNQ